MRIARWAFTIFLTAPLAASLLAGTALAQDQDNSLAAAARRAQEQKKDQPKAAKVYDNDTIPTNGPVNVVGQEQPAGGSSTTADTSSNAMTVESSKSAPTAADVADLNSDLASAKQRLADLKADLDVAQRKYALDQQTYLSDPNHSMNKAGAASLDAEKSDIDAKAEAVADAEKVLAAAQAKVDEATKESAAAAQAKSAPAQSQNSAPAAAPPSANAPQAPASDTVTVNRQ
jgi:colicin import membrane protein